MWVVPPQRNSFSSRIPHQGQRSCIIGSSLLSRSVGDAGRRCLIYQAPARESLELKGFRELMVAAGGEHVSEGPAAGGNRLEAAGAPAAVDVELGNPRGPDDRTRVVDHIDDPCPLAQQPQPAE